MSDTVPSPQHPETSTTTVTLTETADEQDHAVPRVTVKLKKPKNNRKVQWSTETVDNENLGKKKSKCCCIFNKPRKFGESSSEESDDECEHCQGHVEKKRAAQALASPEDTSMTETIDRDPLIPNSGEPGQHALQ